MVTLGRWHVELPDMGPCMSATPTPGCRTSEEPRPEWYDQYWAGKVHFLGLSGLLHWLTGPRPSQNLLCAWAPSCLSRCPPFSSVRSNLRGVGQSVGQWGLGPTTSEPYLLREIFPFFHLTHAHCRHGSLGRRRSPHPHARRSWPPPSHARRQRPPPPPECGGSCRPPRVLPSADV
jgi:hypothetical protein